MLGLGGMPAPRPEGAQSINPGHRLALFAVALLTQALKGRYSDRDSVPHVSVVVGIAVAMEASPQFIL